MTSSIAANKPQSLIHSYLELAAHGPFVPSRPVAAILQKLEQVSPSSVDGKWTARCPAHDDENPSLSVSQGDDGRALLTCHAGCALEKVLEAIGLTTADLFESPAAEATPQGAQSPEPQAAEVSHFQQRWQDCRLPGDSLALLPLASQFGVDSEVLVRMGVGQSNSCWIFPERNASGAIVGLATRAADGSKACVAGSRRGLIIPDDLASLDGVVLLVEGPSDVAACLQLGLPAVGRPSNRGGAEEIAKLLSSRSVLVVGENDRREDGSWPGKEGARSTAETLSKTWERAVGFALPPESVKDIRAFLHQEQGAGAEIDDIRERLLNHLMESMTSVDRRKVAKLAIDIEPTGRVRDNVFVSFDGEQILFDEIKLAKSTERQQFAQKILEMIPQAELTENDIETALLDQIQSMRERKREDECQCEPDDVEGLLRNLDKQIELELKRIPSEVIEEAEAMLADPNLMKIIQEDIAMIGVVGEERLALTIYVVGTSRLLSQPLAAIVQGPSSSGKSHVIAKTGALFPKAATLPATDITPNALYYGPVDALVHRFVMAGERPRQQDEQRAEATRALRELISAGVLSKLVPTKAKSGEVRTELIKRLGPIAYVESTTASEIFDEDVNRCLLLSTDESPDQSRRIVETMAMLAEEPVTSDQIERVIQKHHAAQLMLQRHPVSIPFARRIGKAMPSERPESRRAIGNVLKVIKAVALLHQKQRVIHDGAIRATVKDYEVARELLLEPMGRLMGDDIPPAASNLLERLRKRYPGERFTTTKATKDDSTIKDSRKMAGYLKLLAERGAVELYEGGRGSQPHTWYVNSEQVAFGEVWLPEPSLIDTALSEISSASAEPERDGAEAESEGTA